MSETPVITGSQVHAMFNRLDEIREKLIKLETVVNMSQELARRDRDEFKDDFLSLAKRVQKLEETSAKSSWVPILVTGGLAAGISGLIAKLINLAK